MKRIKYHGVETGVQLNFFYLYFSQVVHFLSPKFSYFMFHALLMASIQVILFLKYFHFTLMKLTSLQFLMDSFVLYMFIYIQVYILALSRNLLYKNCSGLFFWARLVFIKRLWQQTFNSISHWKQKKCSSQSFFMSMSQSNVLELHRNLCLTIFTRKDVKDCHQRLHKMGAPFMDLNKTSGLFQTGQDHPASDFTASHYIALNTCFRGFQELKSVALLLANINTLYLKETVLCICQHFPFSLAA